MIDLRSDTVTRPTPEMLAAMVAAPVGDDVIGDDPTVRELEQTVAGLLGKPAALFVPSGTMGNQLGIRVHCQPGDEFICDSQCHIFYYEQAAYAQLFGVSVRTVSTRVGVLSTEHLQSAIHKDDIHHPRTRLLCLENTHNRRGGTLLPLEEVRAVCDLAHQRGLATHLDGARLWNAAVASGRAWRVAIRDWAAPFDTVSVCFSKGLGAPVGSALVGSVEQIAFARRVRKAMGGGWRQAGLLAAGALHALEHHVERLADDHSRARRLADAVHELPGLAITDGRCDTNLLFIDVEPSLGSASEFVGRLEAEGVQCFALNPQRIRLVTHLDLDEAAIDSAIAALQAATS